ncbi:type I DNA topoisomerase [Blattabacterium cuenoti]|uniref:type I DNA topoisomerase n=1 Tax=Blattabacterium cuenoti TaxID=1653831 RepID=UPI00163C006F|nr:type I DNA topoisomerase [Blattabacterium cuenoti]
MKENLVIVESPTKAKTIQTFLGKNYYVTPSYGHIIDLPEKELGINIQEDFKPNYVVLPKKKNIVKCLDNLIKNYKNIWLASDEDREGEAIAYQICKRFNIQNEKYKRIVFHEITKKSIFFAIKNPRTLNYDLIYAQQARRILDRLVGFKLSPILWKKIGKGLSAGRVQSVALRLIIEREKEIKEKNISLQHYYIYGTFEHKKNKIFTTKIEKKIDNEEKMKNILLSCINSTFKIKKIVTKQEKKISPIPFTTSSLQQEASVKLSYSISKTMLLAQKLYEKGYITYHRTDSTRISDEILSKIREFIIDTYGNMYLFAKNKFLKKKFSQEAHESIRPTVINNIITNNRYLVSLDTDQRNLYKLIWKRTIAGQMSDCITEKKIFFIQSSNFEELFSYTKKYIVFDGFTILDSSKKDKEKDFIEEIKEQDTLNNVEFLAKQIVKNNIYRHSEASLVRDLEKLGIGRPSTYVPIINTLQKRNYIVKQKLIKEIKKQKIFFIKKNNIFEKKIEIVEIEKNKFFPTDMGFLTIKFLKKNFKEITDYHFTAKMEKSLDDVAIGKKSWILIIKNFYKEFIKRIQYVEKHVEKINKERFLGVDPISKRKIFVKIARFGPVIQVGEFHEKNRPQFYPLLNIKKMNTISLEEAIKISKLPKSLGFFNGEEIFLKINKQGIHIKYKNLSIPIEDKVFFESINLEKAINILKKTLIN